MTDKKEAAPGTAGRGRDVLAVADVQRQAGAAEPGAELLAAEERGQPAGAGQKVNGFADDRLLNHRASGLPRHRRA